MILVKDAIGSTTYWIEQPHVEDIDAYVDTMSEALEGDENAPKPRQFEVMEVEVVRRINVARRVQTNVLVDVTEGNH
jgi:hypothetical protein